MSENSGKTKEKTMTKEEKWKKIDEWAKLMAETHAKQIAEIMETCGYMGEK